MLRSGDTSQAETREAGRSASRRSPPSARISGTAIETRRLLDRKARQQAGICAICHEEFTDYNDIVPDHKNPKGMGGARRADHPDNIQATHWWCNAEKGSTRMNDSRPISRSCLKNMPADRKSASVMCPSGHTLREKRSLTCENIFAEVRSSYHANQGVNQGTSCSARATSPPT
jgi:hypothetical protein